MSARFRLQTCPKPGSALPPGLPLSQEGFTLAETLIALSLLSVGLLAAGELLLITLRSISLSRSTDAASVIVQSRLDQLADLYRQNPNAADLNIGNHGPEQIVVSDPSDGSTLNRFSVSWTVSPVSDPRSGMSLEAIQVLITATPVLADNTSHRRASLNKVVNTVSIFSPRAP